MRLLDRQTRLISAWGGGSDDKSIRPKRVEFRAFVDYDDDLGC